MMVDTQRTHAARRGDRGVRARASSRSRSLVLAQLGGLLLAATIMLAAPAQALSAPEPEQQASVAQQQGSPAREHALVGKATPRGGLPFAQPDLALLVLGGAIVTLAGVGAPFLLHPLRGMPPFLVAAATASEPGLPASAQGGAARATA